MRPSETSSDYPIGVIVAEAVAQGRRNTDSTWQPDIEQMSLLAALSDQAEYFHRPFFTLE